MRTASVTVAASVESDVRFWNSATSTMSFSASASLPISVPARPCLLYSVAPTTPTTINASAPPANRRLRVRRCVDTEAGGER